MRLSKSYLLLALILSAVTGVCLWYITRIDPLWIYGMTLTMMTFLFYGYDKYQAIHQKTRVPEIVLHLLTLAGGTAGAFAGQLLFRHKTKKWSFRLVFIMIAVLQIGFVLWWYLSERV